MFYAAFDEKTVLNEINSSGDNFATIASFKVRRPLTVLDLSKLRKMRIPSIFDKKERHKRAPITFLKAFANEISQRIDDLPNIEYVPTQIVTEYFRYVFKSEDFDRIDGIIYNSSQNEAGYCIVLFMDQQEFLDDDKCMLDKDSVRLKYYQKNFVPIELDVK